MKTNKNLDDLWINGMKQIRDHGEFSFPRGLEIKEVLAYSACLENPRQRYIFNPERKMSIFYAIGEEMWYLSGDNSVDFISYYSKVWRNMSDDGKTLNSAYGHRIFSGEHPLIPFNQFFEVKNKLRKDPDSRQAIINLHTPTNKLTKDSVCTLTLQFLIRNNKLNMIANMRSNDGVFGTTFDIYAFTIFQEMLALELGVELGKYYHSAGSFHIYKKHYQKIEQSIRAYDNEFYPVCYDDIIMPKEFIKEIPRLLDIEKSIRLTGSLLNKDISGLSKYSRNRVYILRIYNLMKKDINNAKEYYESVKDDMYKTYIILVDMHF